MISNLIPLSFSKHYNDFANLFTGYELYEKGYHYLIKPSVRGVVRLPQKMPYALQSKLKNISNLDNMKVSLYFSQVCMRIARNTSSLTTALKLDFSHQG